MLTINRKPPVAIDLRWHWKVIQVIWMKSQNVEYPQNDEQQRLRLKWRPRDQIAKSTAITMITKPCLFVLEATSHTHKHTCTKGGSYARPERPTIETPRVETWWVLGRGSSLVAPLHQLRVWRALSGSCESPDLWAFIYLSEFDWPLGRPSRHCFEWFLA